MNRRLSRTLFGFVAMLSAALPAATAAATGIHTQTKGEDAVASFTIRDNITCPGGDVRVMQTFVGIVAFETTIRSKGQMMTTLATNVDVSSFNPCTNDFSFNDGIFYGGALPMTALDKATLVGHYVFSTGMVVDANLTLTGTDQITSGHSMNRQSLGGVVTTIRTIGSTRSASITGTVTIDGRVITTSQMTDVDGSMARNTSGEIIVIRSGS